MKTKNPKSRYHLEINKRDLVLEVGGGHNPHYRSNVIVDKFVDSNYHRKSDIKVYKTQEFIQADGEQLPFSNDQFDYVICNQVLEHVENPAEFINEQMRVSKRGYIEVPSLIGEYLFPKESHKWLILEIEEKLILVEKEKYWFNSNLDFGLLFLTYLQSNSIGYKVFMQTKPNFMTMRYEWKNEIEFIVNPTESKYLDYFTKPWNEEMVQEFFPKASNIEEFLLGISSFTSIALNTLRNRFLKKRA